MLEPRRIRAQLRWTAPLCLVNPYVPSKVHGTASGALPTGKVPSPLPLANILVTLFVVLDCYAKISPAR